MSTAAPAPPTTGTELADVDADDSGLCHVLDEDGRTLCGWPIAHDSPGVHRGEPSANPCGGCGRPRCDECAERAHG